MSVTDAVKDAVVAAVISHPPEPVVKTSINAALGGLCLIGGVVILALFNWASHGEKNGKPDVFGKLVKVREVAERYKAAWTPGKFWPPDAFTHTKKREEGYAIYKWVWTFLLGWLGCSGFFLVFAGLLPEIEVFREEAHLRAAACVAAALCLCAVWPIFFRVGSTAESEADDLSRLAKEDMLADPTQTAFRIGSRSRSKEVFLWLSFGLLLLASGFAVAGSAILRAWTLPGPQYGTLLFLGPGYGLFAGWIIFAATLNCSIAISYNSYPAGTLQWPETRTEYTHRDSLWPLAVAILLASISLIILDPAIPLPFLLAVLLFTPRHVTHLVACGVCAVAIGGTAWLVWIERG